MFEVIVSTVSTGRVVRKSFATRDEANRYVEKLRDSWANRKRPVSARDYCIEIEYRVPELPAAHAHPLPAAA